MVVLEYKDEGLGVDVLLSPFERSIYDQFACPDDEQVLNDIALCVVKIYQTYDYPWTLDWNITQYLEANHFYDDV